MPRRVDDSHQPQLAPTAADLGEEAYRANLDDQPGPEPAGEAVRDISPIWKAPQAKNPPPGQHREDAQEVKIGQDLKRQGGVGRTPGTQDAPR